MKTAQQPADWSAILPLDMANMDVLVAELRRHIQMARLRGREHSLAHIPCTWMALEKLLNTSGL